MSRRRRAVSRPIPKDAKFNSALVTRLVNTVMKQGNKSVA
ncbi:MAG TPA: 30S ribosomal protein S7, partial [Verrucomicrobiota bacterium]|nr:30S ribosomal protein S7 [Verrucomicrobiota bacterium]